MPTCDRFRNTDTPLLEVLYISYDSVRPLETIFFKTEEKRVKRPE